MDKIDSGIQRRLDTPFTIEEMKENSKLLLQSAPDPEGTIGNSTSAASTFPKLRKKRENLSILLNKYNADTKHTKSRGWHGEGCTTQRRQVVIL